MSSTTLKHKNSDPLPNSEHAGYWPYSREQYSHASIIFERFKSWKYRLEEVEEFFNENEKIERQLSKQYKKIAEAFKPTEDEYGGTSTYLTPIYNSAVSLSKEHDDFSKVMQEKINKRIAEIKREHETKYRYLKNRVEEAQKETANIRNLTITSINNHEKATNANINAKQQMDPWLTERVVVNVLDKMINHENSFQAFMNKMFSDIAAFDESTVQRLQSIFTDFSNFKISQYGNLSGHYNNLLPFVNNIQSAGPFRDFDRRYQITTNDIWSKKRTLEDFSYKIQPHTIVKEGPLYRTAEIRSSHWKPVWVILTDTGYLHCFKMEMEKKVIRDYTIKRQGTGSNIVAEGQKAYTDLKKPETYFSLRIGNNIKCVETTKRKAPKYTFDLVLDSSIKSRGPGDYNVAAEEIKRKKTFFGSSKKQDVNVVFTLRADTQEIYNNWVDKINAVAESSTFTDSLSSIHASPSVLSSTGSINTSKSSISASESIRSTPSVSRANSPALSPLSNSVASIPPADAAAATAAASTAPATAAASAPAATDATRAAADAAAAPAAATAATATAAAASAPAAPATAGNVVEPKVETPQVSQTDLFKTSLYDIPAEAEKASDKEKEKPVAA